ncbi:MAG: hypothetical protein A3F13_08395 [Gammaproteobacteria bacterium RIFCSPHIGHO2_12_FULL_40_19]|nr:MAG: hypothetical protein A3F13_08395 [Gammaproteobacteria bacterium RIFCSPHIGHO2_12_FULL_40_19]
MDDHQIRLIVAAIIIFLVTIVYCWVLFQIMQRVPRDKHQFPSWFIWLFLIPWIGLVFQLIMLPFGIPNTFKRAFPNNQDAIRDADNLFKMGLTQVVLTVFGMFLPIPPINHIASVAGFILWIVYWVMIVKFKNTYLKNA